jgi:hypothetical protein
LLIVEPPSRTADKLSGICPFRAGSCDKIRNMSTFHVLHQFHAVGHGTFFTGVVRGGAGDAFRWVYDCGSKRRTRIGKAIGRLAAWDHWPPGLTIDLVAISHFDDDHINGLEALLGRYRVKWLVLPYVGLKQRLAHAASLLGSDVSSAATAGFALDPLGFLAARGLSNRVDGILLIQGGEGGDGVPDFGAPLLDPNDSGDSNQLRGRPHTRASAAFPANAQAAQTASEPRIHLRPHSHPIGVPGMPIEFVFYNTALPSGHANRSRQTLEMVASEVEAILARFNVLDPLGSPRRGWRDKLKACYGRHFGTSGLERNSISLCAFVRPVVSTGIRRCNLFAGAFASDDIQTHIPVKDDGQALLLTGDLTLDGREIDAMKSHFRSWRWQQLRVIQVPHHGSRHSWAPGSALRFPGPHFVHCVPTETPGKVRHHPHAMVNADLILSGAQVHYANYDQSVVQSYHFEA